MKKLCLQWDIQEHRVDIMVIIKVITTVKEEEVENGDN